MGAETVQVAQKLSEQLGQVIELAKARPEPKLSEQLGQVIELTKAWPEPVTQDDATALAAKLTAAQTVAERTAALTALEKYYREREDERRAAERQAPLSLAEVGERVADEAQTVKADVKALYGRLGKMHVGSPKAWDQAWPGRTPESVVIGGGWERCQRQNELTELLPGAQTRKHASRWTGRRPMLPTDDGLLKDVRQMGDGLRLWQMGKSAQENRPVRFEEHPEFAHYVTLRKDLRRALMGTKALDTTDTSGFVPTDWSAELIGRIDLEGEFLREIPTVRVDRWPHVMPRKGMTAPTMHTYAEQTADHEAATRQTAIDLGSGSLTVSETNFATRVEWSQQLLKNSVVDIADWAYEELARAHDHSLARACINGDAVGAHMDSDTDAGAATLPEKAWNGWRQECVANGYETDATNVIPTSDQIGTMMKQLGKYGGNKADLFLLYAPGMMWDFANLKEASGIPVVVSSGQQEPWALSEARIQMLLGAQTFVSEHCRIVLNAAGVYDGVTTNRRDLTVVNRRGWVLAYDNASPQFALTQLTWETWQWVLAMTISYDFEDMLPIATEHTTHRLYNIAA